MATTLIASVAVGSYTSTVKRSSCLFLSRCRNVSLPTCDIWKKSSSNARNLEFKRRSNTALRSQASSSPVYTPTPEEQLQFSEEVKGRLASEYPDLPTGLNGRDDDNLINWFLKDRKYNVENTVLKVSKAILWRHELQVNSLTDELVADEAKTGKAYLNEYFDNSGRPVVIVTASKHVPQEDPVPTHQLCIHLIEKAIARTPPGEDKFLGIFDLRNFRPENTDWSFVKFFIDVFFNYYPKRLGLVLFVEAPFYFQPGWNIIKPLLKNYASLVLFVTANEVKEKFFTPETVPETFRD